jgi:hypothetical protein
MNRPCLWTRIDGIVAVDTLRGGCSGATMTVGGGWLYSPPRVGRRGVSAAVGLPAVPVGPGGPGGLAGGAWARGGMAMRARGSRGGRPERGGRRRR